MAVDRRLALLASSPPDGGLDLRQVRDALHSGPAAMRSLAWLEDEGLVFRTGTGLYASPPHDRLAPALAKEDPDERLASWLPGWLSLARNVKTLPVGLDWAAARFLALRVRGTTDLQWDGPKLCVPIAAGATHLGRMNNRLSVFACDFAFGAETVRLPGGAPVRLPFRRDVVRLLAVHQDPRLQEAAAKVELGEKNRRDLASLISRTDPPMPFPQPKARLPAGPPFRYRLYAPLSWIRRNISHSHPLRGRSSRRPRRGR